MEIVNIHHAKTHLSRLVERAAAGEEIIIAKAGHPMARLTAYRVNEEPREPGFWAGKVRIGDDFDILPEEIASAFRGESR